MQKELKPVQVLVGDSPARGGAEHLLLPLTNPGTSSPHLPAVLPALRGPAQTFSVPGTNRSHMPEGEQRCTCGCTRLPLFWASEDFLEEAIPKGLKLTTETWPQRSLEFPALPQPLTDVYFMVLGVPRPLYRGTHKHKCNYCTGAAQKRLVWGFMPLLGRGK